VPGKISEWGWAGRVVTVRAYGDRAVFTIDGRDVVVGVTWHEGTLGGFWPSWRCRCGRGAYLVYGDDLTCFRCAGLGHATRLIRAPALWQVRRLRRKLGDGPRPLKGGHQILYFDRLMRKIAVAESAALVAADRMAAALERRKNADERRQQRQQRRRHSPAGSKG
jgi:hypothetical protein